MHATLKLIGNHHLLMAHRKHSATVANHAAPLEDRQYASENLRIIAAEVAARARWN